MQALPTKITHHDGSTLQQWTEQPKDTARVDRFSFPRSKQV